MNKIKTIFSFLLIIFVKAPIAIVKAAYYVFLNRKFKNGNELMWGKRMIELFKTIEKQIAELKINSNSENIDYKKAIESTKIMIIAAKNNTIDS